MTKYQNLNQRPKMKKLKNYFKDLKDRYQLWAYNQGYIAGKKFAEVLIKYQEKNG